MSRTVNKKGLRIRTSLRRKLKRFKKRTLKFVRKRKVWID